MEDPNSAATAVVGGEEEEVVAAHGGAEEWPVVAGRATDLLMAAGRFKDLIGHAGNADSPTISGESTACTVRLPMEAPSLFPRLPEAQFFGSRLVNSLWIYNIRVSFGICMSRQF